MRTASKNIMTIDKNALNESIVKSMIASFKIEKIYIPEKTAQAIFRRVLKRLKKEA
jgi:hypothetical protein